MITVRHGSESKLDFFTLQCNRNWEIWFHSSAYQNHELKQWSFDSAAFACYGNLMSLTTLRSCYEFTDAVTSKDGVYSSGFATCKNERTSFSSDPNNCGSCGAQCPSGPHSQRICKSGTCSIFCNTRESRDCDGNSSNGCEINVEKDPKNCGTCGVACNVPQNGNSTWSRGGIGKMHCAQGLKLWNNHLQQRYQLLADPERGQQLRRLRQNLRQRSQRWRHLLGGGLRAELPLRVSKIATAMPATDARSTPATK